MKFHVIACNVLARECYRAAANSPHVVTVDIQPFGLHSEPDELRKTLQAEIDQASAGIPPANPQSEIPSPESAICNPKSEIRSPKYDYILLAYGLCSRGTADLVAREIPIVIPRSHDCIALLLGSHERYQTEFGGHPGTYYYSPGWVEHCEGEVTQSGFEIVKHRQYEDRFKEYVEKFGEDNARFLMEQETQWLANYNRAVFLNMGLGDSDYYRAFTQKIAESHGWSYEELLGDTRLIDRLLAGDWEDTEFLIVKPGQRTVESINSGIITAI